jgi:hypothetical protein
VPDSALGGYNKGISKECIASIVRTGVMIQNVRADFATRSARGRRQGKVSLDVVGVNDQSAKSWSRELAFFRDQHHANLEIKKKIDKASLSFNINTPL